MKLLSLTPSFSSTQDGPDFVLTLQNDTSRPLNLVELLRTSALVLDGKPYPNQMIRFAGNASVAPGQTHSLLISPDTYLLGAERKAYSPVLKRWRWKTALKPGTHTISVRLGNAQIGPVAFIWNDTTPLLYR